MSLLSASKDHSAEQRNGRHNGRRQQQQETGNAGGNLIHRLARRFVHRRLNELRFGKLCIADDQSSIDFGVAKAGELSATVHVHHPGFYPRLLFGGALGAAEAYLNGWWGSDDLTSTFRILARNSNILTKLNGGLSKVAKGAGRIGHLLRRNSLSGSRRNIADHYDLGDRFYELFLDETMTYSCGVFAQPDCTLEEASLVKYDRICRKLELSPSDRVLEIGAGWGGFAHYAAKNYGCRVTTTTISQNQYEFARRKIERAGLSDRVTILCEDYRRLNGQYDKLVSIEMIEAVGHEYLDTYFRQCSSLLNNEGMMLLQAITMPDHRYDSYRRSVDFIQRYIFPGGCLPSISAISDSLRRVTDFRIFHLEDFGPHYVETLAHWRRRFLANLPAVREQGFDDHFIRQWEYYLCYCEAGFLERQIGLAQILLTKPDCRREPLLMWP